MFERLLQTRCWIWHLAQDTTPDQTPLPLVLLICRHPLLASSAYDDGKHTLYLRFRSGEVYRYFEFPDQQYRELLDAESRGRYFLNNIRNRFRYERLAKLHAA